MEMISDILARYSTDKVNPHTYGGTYNYLFKDFDRSAPLNILEIGVQKGGSLCAWADYFPNATVTGIDIADQVLPEYRRKEINYIFQDINDYKTDTKFDIIIDDGSHYLKDVARSVSLLSRNLTVGGIFIIEDVQFPDTLIPMVNDILNPNWDYNGDFRWMVSYYNHSIPGLEDDFLFIIKRKI